MSTVYRGLGRLEAGTLLRIDGLDWTVDAVEAQYGRLRLRSVDGTLMQRSIRWLLGYPDCRILPAPEAPPPEHGGGQPSSWDDLTAHQQELARLRAAHLLETETGFRSGDPSRRLAGEPRPGYDPQQTTVTQRRQAKVRELKGFGGQEAALLGLGQISERTLKRMAQRWRQHGLLGCADGRWLRVSNGHPSISEPVREAIFAVRAECLHRSRITMRARERLIHQYLREKFGDGVPVPSYNTLRTVWAEWFGPGGARQRYLRSANAVQTSLAHVVVHRPGQVVALDTTPLPVKVRETMFGTPVTTYLTLAIDVYTHSLVAFRLTLVSDTSIDVAMLLRDVMLPLPMRDGWGDELEWPYPGVPAAVVAEFAGHRVAGLPFFTPETVTTDHGAVYKNHDLVAAQRVLGCNILPARTLRPTDKHAVERAFGAARSLLFEHLPGYTGVDVADRGADPETDAALTFTQMEHLIATWIVAIWQNRRLGEHAPAWGPGEEHSPNTLFAAAMNQGGFALQIPEPQSYYQLLPAHFVKIHDRRGVNICGLWYDGPGLNGHRSQPSGRGGRHKNRWVVRADRRDRRTVFFQDPGNPDRWHVLRWNGLPPQGEIPAFSDATADDLLAEARSRGVSPLSDSELLPVLLDLLGGYIPVTDWPTQMSKADKTARARQAEQAQAAHRDQAHPRMPSPRSNSGPAAPSWPQQAQRTQDAIDAERRRRREAAVTGRPQPPELMSDALRRSSLFLIPSDDAADTHTNPDDAPVGNESAGDVAEQAPQP